MHIGLVLRASFHPFPGRLKLRKPEVQRQVHTPCWVIAERVPIHAPVPYVPSPENIVALCHSVVRGIWLKGKTGDNAELPSYEGKHVNEHCMDRYGKGLGL